MNQHLCNYRKLRDRIDMVTAKLENQHKKHLACKMGCDLCCMDYSIFPVEFYSIREALLKRDIPKDLPFLNDKSSCVFLKEHICTVYDERPVICRTHGLPLLYMNNDNEWELSACELNFTEFDLDEFTNKNTFPQDIYNSRLFLINREFIKAFREKNFGEFDLIPVRQLLEEIE